MKKIDTSKFDAFLAQEKKLPATYTALSETFDAAAQKLLEHWEGEGADAFRRDADIILRNMTELGDSLALLCATVRDIHELLLEADAQIGRANREAVDGTA